LAAPLIPLHDTLVCRGTPVGNHCLKGTVRSHIFGSFSHPCRPVSGTLTYYVLCIFFFGMFYIPLIRTFSSSSFWLIVSKSRPNFNKFIKVSFRQRGENNWQNYNHFVSPKCNFFEEMQCSSFFIWIPHRWRKSQENGFPVLVFFVFNSGSDKILQRLVNFLFHLWSHNFWEIVFFQIYSGIFTIVEISFTSFSLRKLRI